MEQQLSLLILCSFLLQESSAGLGLPSSITFMLLPIKVEATNLSLFGGKNRFLFQLKVSHPKVFHAQLPLHHPSTRDSHTSPSPLSAHHNHHLRKKFHHGRQNVPSPSPSPLPSSMRWTRKGPLPFPAIPSNHLKGPSRSPTVSPMSSPAVSNKKYLPPLPSMALPPPPPNQAYSSSTPIQISPYTFFPMVSELAEEIAQTVPLDRSQVCIMGADAADQELEKTSVLIHESHKQKMNAVVSSLSSCEQKMGSLIIL